MSLTSLAAGGLAGLVVDATLFPLDTLKTRLQATPRGKVALRYSRLYSGLGPVLLGSVPCAAIFFFVYDSCKLLGGGKSWQVQCGAAALGEAAACLVRVPVEVVKQRRQAGATKVARALVMQEGARGFYRGFPATLAREVPFSLVQFPIWELLRREMGRQRGRTVTPGESSVCGAVGGVVAGVVTTPLDLVKTRIMLSSGRREGSLAVLARVVREEGWRGLTAGMAPRLVWIALGSVIFFGAYEQFLVILS